MEITLNQLVEELQLIATEHKKINDFFFGDFIDAVTSDTAKYPLMVATLQPSGMDDNVVNVNLIITICDKYNLGEFRQIREIHSDCLSICNDLKITFKQERWQEFSDVQTAISTDPFINRSQDMTAGWTMVANVGIYSSDNWCDLPYDNYDFQND